MRAQTARLAGPLPEPDPADPRPPGGRDRAAVRLVTVTDLAGPAGTDGGEAAAIAAFARELAHTGGDLAALLEAAAAAWPAIRLPREAFLRHVATAVIRRNPPDRLVHLASLRLADLYLACGCLAGDGEALRALEGMLSSVPTIVRFIGTDRGFVEDVRALVAEELLVAGKRPLPKLARYSGEGALRGWFTVVVQRAALALRKSGGGPVPLASLDDLSGLLESRLEPELELLKARFVPQLHAALNEAVGRLSRRERILLRLSMVEGVNMRQIARSYRVNQSTISRWLGRALDLVHEGVRQALRERCGLGASEVDSLIDAVRSRVDVSLAALLTTSIGADLREVADEVP
jgi:RNA polymerase sigma-70 factor, ECF subfamily